MRRLITHTCGHQSLVNIEPGPDPYTGSAKEQTLCTRCLGCFQRLFERNPDVDDAEVIAAGTAILERNGNPTPEEDYECIMERGHLCGVYEDDARWLRERRARQ